VAAIRAVGVRDDPSGAMRCIAPLGSPHIPTARIATTTPRLIVRILKI